MALSSFAQAVVQVGMNLEGSSVESTRKDPVAQAWTQEKLSTIQEASLAALRAYTEGRGWFRPNGAVHKVKDEANLVPGPRRSGFVISKDYKGFQSWMQSYGYKVGQFIDREWYRLNLVWKLDRGPDCLCPEARLFHETVKTLGSEGQLLV